MASISGRVHHCLLDSGADVSLAPSRFVDSAQLTSTTCPLLAVNNTSFAVDGTARLPVVINGRKLTSAFFVTPNIDEFILRRDWHTDNRVIWDFSGQSITFDGKARRLKDCHSTAPSCKRAITRADITVPLRSEAILPSYIVYSGLDKSASSPTHWTTTLHSLVNGLRVARTLIDRESGNIGVRVCNTTERPIWLYRGCTISPLQPACMVSPDLPEVQNCTTALPNTVNIVIGGSMACRYTTALPDATNIGIDGSTARHHATTSHHATVIRGSTSMTRQSSEILSSCRKQSVRFQNPDRPSRRSLSHVVTTARSQFSST